MIRLDDHRLGLYIHVPFCKARCPYCDFYSLPSLAMADAYTDAVIEELSTLRRTRTVIGENGMPSTVNSIYFGGGTPSHLGSERLNRILSTVRSRFDVMPDAEITVECNPSGVDMPRFFASLHAAGVNRISLGMQSGVDEERRSLGRAASPQRVAEVAWDAARAGFDNISVDLMIGIPCQSLGSLEQSLSFALTLPVTHLSVYMLKIEEGTFFYKKRDSLPLPDEDTVADMYLFVCDYLKKRGMRHYEISNFCFDDRISSHNMRYWQLGEYWGVGPGAHSLLNGRRFYYERDLAGFISGKPPVPDGTGSDAQEALMLSLRLDTGLDIPEYCQIYNLKYDKKAENFINLCVKQGLATCDGAVLCLTDRGMLVSNAIIAELSELF